MIAKATLNPQAWAIEETESEIRDYVISSVIKRTEKSIIDNGVKKIIRKGLKDVIIPKLRAAAIQSLMQFYARQYRTALTLFGGDFSTLSIILAAAKTNDKTEHIRAYNVLKERGYDFPMTVNQYGVPNKEFWRSYLNEKVKPTVDRLCQQFAIDPNDKEGRNSLRNRAEMEVRYQKHLDDIAALKAAGHKLVICSTHADCSKRCARWQGKVFSLDGTSGTTDDGRRYEPIENATDENQVYWTNPKTGTQYKGGLLGYNCRHYLVPYQSGYEFPQPNREQERKQYEITVKQRYLERQVRKWKVEALTARYSDPKRYEFAKEKSKTWQNAYINFSKANDRAYYRSRIQIA